MRFSPAAIPVAAGPSPSSRPLATMIHALRRLLPAFCLFGLFAPAGCGEGTSGGTVNGTVTLDGQPLKDGLVSFAPADGKGQTADAKITDGKFTLKLPVGTMKVMISAPKVVGKKKMYDTPDAPSVDEIKELLPEKYNAQSKLTVTVKAGTQDETFALTSK
jgi:hypothetical protein